MADDSDAPTVYEKPSKSPKTIENSDSGGPVSISKELSKPMDSPDLTNSLSTPSSNSRKTYNAVPAFLESDVDECSETYTLVEVDRDNLNNSISKVHKRPKLWNIATKPSESDLLDDNDKGYEKAILNAFAGSNINSINLNPRNVDIVSKDSVSKGETSDLLRKENSEVTTDSFLMQDNIAPKAESEDDNLSNDDLYKGDL